MNYGTFDVTPKDFPATIPSSGSYISGPLPAGYGALMATVLSDNTGAINVQRYADAALTIPIGAVITGAIVGGTQETIHSVDGVPFMFFTVEVTNTGGDAANVSKFAVLTGPLP